LIAVVLSELAFLWNFAGRQAPRRRRYNLLEDRNPPLRCIAAFRSYASCFSGGSESSTTMYRSFPKLRLRFLGGSESSTTMYRSFPKLRLMFLGGSESSTTMYRSFPKLRRVTFISAFLPISPRLFAESCRTLPEQSVREESAKSR